MGKYQICQPNELIHCIFVSYPSALGFPEHAHIVLRLWFDATVEKSFSSHLMYIQMYALVSSSPAGSKYNYMVCDPANIAQSKDFPSQHITDLKQGQGQCSQL